jgi:YtkA-like
MRLLRLLSPLALLAFVASPLAACVTSSAGSSDGSGGSGTEQQSLCATEPGVESYQAGLTATSADGALKVTLMDAAPSPPEKVNDNTWTVTITSGGAPVTSTGATITLLPWMPQHGHGSSVVPQIMPMSTPGMYQVTVLDFFMAGIWTNTFTVTPTSGPVETAVFTFCIDG